MVSHNSYIIMSRNTDSGQLAENNELAEKKRSIKQGIANKGLLHSPTTDIRTLNAHLV